MTEALKELENFVNLLIQAPIGVLLVILAALVLILGIMLTIRAIIRILRRPQNEVTLGTMLNELIKINGDLVTNQQNTNRAIEGYSAAINNLAEAVRKGTEDTQKSLRDSIDRMGNSRGEIFTRFDDTIAAVKASEGVVVEAVNGTGQKLVATQATHAETIEGKAETNRQLIALNGTRLEGISKAMEETGKVIKSVEQNGHATREAIDTLLEAVKKLREQQDVLVRDMAALRGQGAAQKDQGALIQQMGQRLESLTAAVTKLDKDLQAHLNAPKAPDPLVVPPPGPQTDS